LGGAYALQQAAFCQRLAVVVVIQVRACSFQGRGASTQVQTTCHSNLADFFCRFRLVLMFSASFAARLDSLETGPR